MYFSLRLGAAQSGKGLPKDGTFKLRNLNDEEGRHGQRGVCMYVRGSVLFQAELAPKCKICTGKETVIPARGSQAQLTCSWWRRQAARSGGTRRWGTSKVRFSAIPERGL